jgi:hypothetical protein
MKKRFISWAGWANSVAFSKDFEGIDILWPIIDNKNCGEINGEPRPDQFYCVAFSSESQAEICKLLNKNVEKEKEK